MGGSSCNCPMMCLLSTTVRMPSSTMLALTSHRPAHSRSRAWLRWGRSEVISKEGLCHGSWICKARGLNDDPIQRLALTRLTSCGIQPPAVTKDLRSALPVVCLWSFFSPAIKSPRTVQQMQPLFISMTFSWPETIQQYRLSAYYWGLLCHSALGVQQRIIYPHLAKKLGSSCQPHVKAPTRSGKNGNDTAPHRTRFL